MPDPRTIERLRRLAFSAAELKSITSWADPVIEDYLNIIGNVATISEIIDGLIDKKIEEITTDFTDGSIPYADGDLLVEDNTNLVWDKATKKLYAKLFNTQQIDFYTSVTTTHQEGRVHWNSEDGTLDVDLANDVSVQVGLELLVRVRNTTGSQIDNGQAVYVNGASGSRPTIALAKADAEATAISFIGLATQDIPDNQNGFVCVAGYVRGVDTSAFVAGNIVYLSDATAGGLTATAPTAPSYVIGVGVVLFANASSGIIAIQPRIYPNLNRIADVYINAPANYNVLKYSSANSRWENSLLNICEVSRTRIVPSLQTVNTGTLTSGTVADVQTWSDGNEVNIKEVTGVPGFDVEYRIDNVSDICNIEVAFYYNGSATHDCQVQIYDDTNAVWKELISQYGAGLSHNLRLTSLPGVASDFINGSDQVKIRFYHPQSGNASHNLYIDYVSIIGKTT